MKVRVLLYMLAAFTIISCSSDGDNTPDNQDVAALIRDQFYLKINGTEIPFYSPDFPDYNPNLNFYNVFGTPVLQNGAFQFNAAFQGKLLTLKFTKLGKLIQISVGTNSVHSSLEPYGATYMNYENFPAHFFDFELESIDEEAKTLTATFSGTLYAQDDDMDSEPMQVEGRISRSYVENSSIPGDFEIFINGYDEGLTAKVSNQFWQATRKYSSVTFTADDAYRFYLNPVAHDGTHTYDPASPSNYVTLMKFNPQTLQYDQLSATGNMTITFYQDWGQYGLFEGDFSFTATNPSNPSETIQVTEGKFRLVKLE